MEIQQAPELPIMTVHPSLRAFRHKNFTLFFTGQSISMIGTWSQMLALSWLVWTMTGSAVWLGVIGFATQLPILLLGLLGGYVADRFDRLRALNLMQALCMLQAIALAVLTMAGLVKLWHVVALAAMLGVVYAFEFPLRQSFVMDMVGKEDLLNAVSLVAAMFHTTRVLGPVAAGAIVAWRGEGVCFLFNAGTFIFLIAALALMDRKKLVRGHHPPSPLMESIRDGLRHVWGRPEAKPALVVVAVISGLGMQFTTLLPIFAQDVFGGGPMQLGLLMGAGGIGSLSGALWLARRPHAERLLSLSSYTATVFSVALIAFALTPKMIPALMILLVLGFCLTVTLSSINTLLQHVTPDHLRGRMMSIFAMTFMGLGPFGCVAAGLMAREIGPQLTLAIFGAACLLTGAIALARAKAMDGGRRQ